MFKQISLFIIILTLLITQTVPNALAAGLCDSAQFVADVTIPDGTTFAPGASFTKTWRFKNNGTCAWSTFYKIAFVGGDSLGAPPPVKLPVAVPPDGTLDISVNLTAPMAAGHYKGLWKFTNSAGAQFGIGSAASEAFWVDINVIETSAVIYDFVANAPYAQWKSGAGVLPYPGASGDSRAYSFQVNNPHLEDGTFDPTPGLLTVPQNKSDGYIQATYPEIQIQKGDKLQTLVNCEFGARDCYVTFRIDYLTAAGSQKTLWSWKEAYDGRLQRANIDLSLLAGQKVRFILMLLSSGAASGDRALWGSPRIVRSGPSQPPGLPPTLTPLPLLTPTPTPFDQPPPIASPGCDKALFVADVTVPDGTRFSPGAVFTKTWRLKNTGTCRWTNAYKLLFYSGERMGAPTSTPITTTVLPGQTVDLTVNMLAPQSAGKYRGNWILSNASGALFGIGANASMPVWVEINVAGESPIGAGYDFTANVCSAEWRSGAGLLPCPGTDGSASGFVVPQAAPKLEDGSFGTAGLLTFPQNKYDGYIQGFYPTITVQPGDRFQTIVGCEFGANCYVTYRLDYMTATGATKTFWTWRERNEKHTYAASLDLTPLAGQSVRFILTILAAGPATNDRALWGSPRIVRVGGAPISTATPIPPTATALPPTLTPSPTADGWLTYTNSAYGFQFKYPPQGQVSGQQDNFVRIDLPFATGTNLQEKYLEAIVAQNIDVCQSPLASQSILRTSETITLNGIPFLKQTGEDAGAGQIYQWIAYSTRKDNTCISLDFILHSTNPGVHATPPPVFDYTAETTLFTQMVSTFAWLSAVPTPSSTLTESGTATASPSPESTMTATATPAPNPSAQDVVAALNARNFDLLKSFMGESFIFAFWQSQGISYPPELAIEQLQTNYLSATPSLTPDPSKDLNALLDGLNPYAIMGLDPAKSQALFVSGWGLNGNDEAILYIAQLPNGRKYWHGVLIAAGGFAVP